MRVVARYHKEECEFSRFYNRSLRERFWGPIIKTEKLVTLVTRYGKLICDNGGTSDASDG